MVATALPTDLQQRLERFTACVQPLGAVIKRVPGNSELVAEVVSIARELNVTRAIVSSEFAAPAPSATSALAAAGIECVVPASVDDSRDQPLGLSVATLAIAETGSVMLAEHALEDRAVGLLTIAHITVVRSSDLVPSLSEASIALREVALRPGGGYASLVTGPSRTADIEMSLTVGVQGPARVFIIFVDELS